MSCRFPRGECSPPLAAFTPAVSLQCLSVYTEFLIASGEVHSGDLGKRDQYPGLRSGWRGQKLPGWACRL